MLGRGGMGTVWLCLDGRIGRRVALKEMNPSLSDSPVPRERFVREAQVQGRLEHPAVVPVYDLDVTDVGASYFTMKRIQGVSLDRIIQWLRVGDDDATRSFPQRRLLGAFSQICLAVDYAHANGVVHRDIKPSNIMLGEFGEVYLLDWGVAKVAGEAPDGEARPRSPISVSGSGADLTRGQMVGTPCYMAPEALGELPGADQPGVDVFALGATLFEILTRRRLNTGETMNQVVDNAAAGLDARPSARTPEAEVPVELERICVEATEADPARRLDSARELHARLEAYLDGERNEALRRELAAAHTEAATAALDGAAAGQALPIQERRKIMGEIGRALALDPGNEQALDAMVSLLSEPPDELPDEVEQKLRADHEAQFVRAGKVASMIYLGMLFYLPLFFWSGVRSPGVVVGFFGAALLSSGLCLWTLRRGRFHPTAALLAMFTSTLCLGSTTFLFGPFFLMPAFVANNTAAYVFLLRGAHRAISVGFGALVIVGAIILEYLGLPWSAYAFTAEGLLIRPGIIHFTSTPTVVMLVVASLATLLTGAITLWVLRNSLARAERRLQLNIWQIGQLVPAIRKSPK